MVRRWMVGLLLAAVGTGCFAATEEDTGESEGAQSKPPLSAETKVQLYHLSEGSEFLPYALLRAVRVKSDGTREPGLGGRPFLSRENLTRYNLIPSPPDVLRRFPVGPGNTVKDLSSANDALPIGVTLARAPDTGLISLGVNCAACHVGQLDVNGKPRVVEGAPNMFAIQEFFRDALTLVRESARDPVFVTRAAAEAAAVRIRFGDVKLDTGDAEDDGDGLIDRMNLISTLVDLASAEDDVAAKKRIDELPSHRFSATRKRLLLSRYYFIKGVKSRRAHGEGTPGGFGRTDAFGVARNALFGHVGEFKATTGQVSYPPMFNMETNFWFHYNANADSVLGRNIGQSLGLGGVVDIYGDDGKGKNASFASSSNLANLAQLEQAIYKIAPPAFPIARNETLAKRGEAVYRAQCRTCHEPKMVDVTGARDGRDHALHLSRELPLGSENDGLKIDDPNKHIGTDPAQAKNFNAPIEELGNATLPQAVSPVFKGIQDWYFRSHPVGRGQADNRAYVWANVFDPLKNPSGRRALSPTFGTVGTFRTRDAYRAPPLDGIWATAPFLHNGSVPTIRALLSKVSERPRLFWVGQRAYDLTNLGYDQSRRPRTPNEAPPGPGISLYDVSLPGNSNQGHEFGVDLPPADKDALIEFLKGFGAGASRPVISR